LFHKEYKDPGGTAQFAAFYLLYVGLAHPDFFLPGVDDLPGLIAPDFALAHEAGDFRFGGLILFPAGFLRLGRFIEHR
jgi:hypothetical protein